MAAWNLANFNRNGQLEILEAYHNNTLARKPQADRWFTLTHDWVVDSLHRHHLEDS